MKNHRRWSQPTRRQFLQVLGGTSALIALSACNPIAVPASTSPAQSAAPASDAPRKGGTLQIILPDDLTTLDPHTPLGVSDVQMPYALYNSLVRRSESEPGAPIFPELAESWEMNEDATVYTFHLRQGVTFSHGTPFTARDVEFSLQRLQDPGTGTSVGPSLRVIEQIEIVDDHTIRFHLSAPNVTLAYNLGGPGVAIIPHDRTPDQLATEPSGTGPFVLAERVLGERTILKRNESYWDSERPYVDEVHLLHIPDPTAQIAALTSGAADLIHQIGLESVPILESTAGVQVLESPQGVYPLLAMHVTEKPFDDVRVRQAFKHAVDRNALHAALMQGRGSVGNDQPIGPGTPFWADVSPLAYDVEKAKQLLADAGYGDGVEVTLTTSDIGGPRVNDVAVAVQEMVKAAGFNVTIEKTPPGSYWTEKYMQVPLFTSWWPVFSDPDGVLPLAYTSQGFYNESGWSDPALDELIASARGETDRAKRAEMYAEVQRIISAEGGVLIPFFAPALQAARNQLRGHLPGPRLVFQNMWLAEA